MFCLKLKSSSYFNDPILKNVKHLCENLNENCYFAINELNQIVSIKNQKISLVYDLNENDSFSLQSELSNVNLIAFGHLPDQELLCLVYENGTICTINSNSKQINKIELEYKLITAEFSCEYDRIALATDTSKLVLLDCCFGEINVSELNDQKQGAVDVLNVGWGKKETQFHGSAGKQSRTVKKELLTCVKFDDLKPRITWRDDGVYFATSVVDPTKSIRKIRIYDNEGILQQTSDENSGLEYLLSWKPNGNLIGSSVSLATGHYFVFFEKNGQRFDEFRLPYKKDEFELQQIVWSNITDHVVILGTEHLNNLAQSQLNLEQTQVILIYSMKNFHWYCQQKLIFTKKQIKKIINQNQLTNEFEPLNLFILFEDGKVGEFVYLNQTNVNENADCAVIDGKRLLFTPFNHSTIPPPMYGYELNFNVEINEICFSQPSGKFLLVKLADKTLHLIERTSKKIELDPSINLVFQSISFKQPNLPLIYASSKGIFKFEDTFNSEFKNSFENDFYQLNLSDKKICYALSTRKKNELILIDLKNVNESKVLFDLNESIHLIYLDIRSLILLDKNGLAWELLESSDLNLSSTNPSPDSSNNELQLQPFTLMNCRTKQEEQIKLKSPVESIVKLKVVQGLIITLCNNYCIYINHLPLQGNDCNSFLIHNYSVLIYTTNDHILKSVRLDDIYYHFTTLCPPSHIENNDFRFVKEETVHDNLASNIENKLKISTDKRLLAKIRPINRTVERGSRLVTICTLDCKLILQMPRGNLETITPRLLILDQIKMLLCTLQYRSAFQLMKKHRINLNFLVDHDLNLFLMNISNFIEQISETNDLCLFLSELSEDNVLETLYSNYNRTKRTICDNSKSLFDLKFPELNVRKCVSNLGDRYCMDGKNVQLDLSYLNDSLDSSSLTKLDRVSTTMRNALIRLDNEKNKYFIPIILTYLKKTKPSIDLALTQIYLKNDKEVRTNALNYLKYIIEMHVLVKEALGTYDLNIARMVYAVSNLDPKEYLQLLAKLETYELPAYRKYQIDLYLKRYDKALANLTKCKPFSDYVNEAIELIKQKNLYQTAIELLSERSDCSQYLKQIYSLYGDYLLIKKYFNEALIVYKKGENFQNAIKAAQLANDWNQIIECATLNFKQGNSSSTSDIDQQFGEANLVKIFESTAEQLDNPKDAKDSSFIYGFYLNDWYRAIKVLIKNYYWADVHRLLINFMSSSGSKCVSLKSSDKFESIDKIESDSENRSNDESIDKSANKSYESIDKSEIESKKIDLNQSQFEELIHLADQTLLLHYQEILDLLNESLNELKKYTERLQKIREDKLNLIEHINLADNLNDLEDEFLNDQSTVSTVNSISLDKQRKLRRNLSNQSQTNTLVTNKSNKNKKDKLSQRYRLKEGSLNEDLALIYHIKTRIEEIENLKSTIKLLIITLAHRDFDELASKLQTMFAKILDVIQFVITIVWQDQEQNANEFLSTTTNQIELVNVIQDIELRKPPTLNVDVDWKLILN